MVDEIAQAYNANVVRLSAAPLAAARGAAGPETDRDKYNGAAAFEVIRFDQLEAILDTRDFVQGLLMDESAFVVYGPSNSGKTFWITDLALHVAAGRRWHGRRVEQGCVLYFTLEGSIGFNNRVAAWKQRHELADASLPFAAVKSSLNLLRGDDDELKRDVARMIETIRSVGAIFGRDVRLVIVDTLARAMAGGDENAPEDMGRLVAAMDEVRAATRVCFGFVHHTGKDEARGMRGHTSLLAAIDTEIEVTGDSETGERCATASKQRDMRKGDRFGFRLDVVELGANPHGETVTTCVAEAADGAMAPAAKRQRHPKGSHSKRALDLLYNILAAPDADFTPWDGIPDGFASCPERIWREKFYADLPEDTPNDSRKKSFQRVLAELTAARHVGKCNNRVWISGR